MRARGIAYDTGLHQPNSAAPQPLDSRPDFDPELVRRELTIIRDDLHCTAVQIIGADPARLETAARSAADLGLEVWFSPYPIDLTTDEMLALFIDCARRAERLRAQGAEIVFVTGVELSVMSRDFLAGDTMEDRVARLLADPVGRPERLAEVGHRVGGFLRDAVSAVREWFHGKVTYAAIQFERVDWDLFDIVTLELMRSAEVAEHFRDGVRSLVQAHSKPVAITGFACATWHGAGDVAPRSMEILQHDDTGTPRVRAGYHRDEDGQAAYLAELLDIFDSENVDSCFVHLFALYNYPHRPDRDPCDDLDLASPGIVAVLDNGRHGITYTDMPWEPKKAFTAIATRYAR